MCSKTAMNTNFKSITLKFSDYFPNFFTANLVIGVFPSVFFPFFGQKEESRPDAILFF